MPTGHDSRDCQFCRGLMNNEQGTLFKGALWYCRRCDREEYVPSIRSLNDMFKRVYDGYFATLVPKYFSIMEQVETSIYHQPVIMSFNEGEKDTTKVEITNKKVLFLSLVTFATGAVIGRYTTPEKVRIEKEIVTVEKKVSDTKTDTQKDKHKKTIVVETKNPDGTETKTTTTEEDTKTEKKTDTKTAEVTKQVEKDLKEVVRNSSPLSVSLLFGTDLAFFGGGTGMPIVYGGSISKPILGPITIGVFGFADKRAGVSIGLMF